MTLDPGQFPHFGSPPWIHHTSNNLHQPPPLVVLGLRTGQADVELDEEDLRVAYRRAVRVEHPDTSQAPDAEARGGGGSPNRWWHGFQHILEHFEGTLPFILGPYIQNNIYIYNNIYKTYIYIYKNT